MPRGGRAPVMIQSDQGFGGEKVGAVEDGEGEPADGAVHIRHHVEIAVPGCGFKHFREVDLHPGGAEEGHPGRLVIQRAHQVISGSPGKIGAHQPLLGNAPGGPSHPPEEEAQDRGRAFLDGLGQLAINVGPLFLLGQQT